MKIAILGFSGSGKSTLARKLAEIYDLPLLHLDRVHFLENWVERPEEESRALVQDFLDRHRDWVIDGNYSKFCQERRLEEADQILYLNFGSWNCLWRVGKRLFHHRGRQRACMADGCEEKIDPGFIWWILVKGRSREKRQHDARLAKDYQRKWVTLKNQREMDTWLKKQNKNSGRTEF